MNFINALEKSAMRFLVEDLEEFEDLKSKKPFHRPTHRVDYKSTVNITGKKSASKSGNFYKNDISRKISFAKCHSQNFDFRKTLFVILIKIVETADRISFI